MPEHSFRKALDIAVAAFGECHPDTVRAWSNLTFNLLAQSRHPESKMLIRKVLTIFVAVRKEDHPDAARTYIILAENLEAQGRFADAEPLAPKSHRYQDCGARCQPYRRDPDVWSDERRRSAPSEQGSRGARPFPRICAGYRVADHKRGTR